MLSTPLAVAARHGNPATLSSIADRRFRFNTTDYTLLMYTSDIQNPTGSDEEPPNINEPPSQRHVDYRKVSSNCGLVGASSCTPTIFRSFLFTASFFFTPPRIIETKNPIL